MQFDAIQHWLTEGLAAYAPLCVVFGVVFWLAYRRTRDDDRAKWFAEIEGAERRIASLRREEDEIQARLMNYRIELSTSQRAQIEDRARAFVAQHRLLASQLEDLVNDMAHTSRKVRGEGSGSKEPDAQHPST